MHPKHEIPEAGGWEARGWRPEAGRPEAGGRRLGGQKPETGVLEVIGSELLVYVCSGLQI